MIEHILSHLISHTIGHRCTPIVGRAFFRTVRRWPIAFAALMLGGEFVGVVVVREAIDKQQWLLLTAGMACQVFYGGLLLMLLHKLRRGTWMAFCDWGYSVFVSMDASHGATNQVDANNGE